MPNGVTPVQERMLKVLSDGLPHSREELHACLHDELGAKSNIWYHVSMLRKVLRPKHQDIVCELYRRNIHYRHIVLLSFLSSPSLTPSSPSPPENPPGEGAPKRTSLRHSGNGRRTSSPRP